MNDEPELAAQFWQRLQPFIPSPVDKRHVIGLHERLRYYRYERGQTCFDLSYPHDEVIIELHEGTAILFLHSLYHEGATVFSGQKYVLRSDVMFE